MSVQTVFRVQSTDHLSLLKSEPPGQKGLKVVSAVFNGGSVCL